MGLARFDTQFIFLVAETNLVATDNKVPEKNGHLAQEEADSVDDLVEKKQVIKEEVKLPCLKKEAIKREKLHSCNIISSDHCYFCVSTG